jgi:hypothetical protein
MSRSGSNQPESLSIKLPMSKYEPIKGKRRKKVVDTNAEKKSCGLIALQGAQGAKKFSLVVLR